MTGRGGGERAGDGEWSGSGECADEGQGSQHRLQHSSTTGGDLRVRYGKQRVREVFESNEVPPLGLLKQPASPTREDRKLLPLLSADPHTLHVH